MQKTTLPCVYDGCNNTVIARGLCRNHYQSARQMVREGKTTWADLEKAGVARPLRRDGPETFVATVLAKVAAAK